MCLTLSVCPRLRVGGSCRKSRTRLTAHPWHVRTQHFYRIGATGFRGWLGWLLVEFNWWRDVPEFVRAQEDPNFRAWVEALEMGLDLCLIDFKNIIPDLPEDDMFSDDAIVIAERAFLDQFPDVKSVDLGDSRVWDFMKYRGQTFVDKLECTWVWQPRLPRVGWSYDSPAISAPWPSMALHDMYTSMTATAHRRTGEEWIYTFRNNREDYVEWKSAQK